MFGVTNLVKNSDKTKWVYSGYGIAFDGAGLWSFGNDFATNITILGADNSSSSHVDNYKNKFIILGGGPTSDINGSFGSHEKKVSIHFTKANTRSCLNLHYNLENSYLAVNGKEIYNSTSLKLIIKMLIFQLNFV